MIATLERRARTTVQGLPATYWYLWAGTLIDRLGAFVVPFLALYLTRQRKVPVDEAAVVVALFGAGGIPASLVGGALADRVGRRGTIILGLVLAALGMLALGFVPEPRLLMPIAFFVGFASSIARPAVSAAIADVVPAEHRARAYSLQYWAINLGFSISPVIAGLLADVSYSALFLADAGTTLVFALLVVLRVPETRPARSGPAAMETTRSGRQVRARGPLRDVAFMAFLGLNLIFAVVFVQHSFTLPIDMQAHGVTAREFGLTIALNGVLIVLVQIPVSRVVGRFKPTRVLLVACLFVGVGFGLTGLVSTVPLYAVTVAVWTAGEILSAAVASTLVAHLAPIEQRGRYQGMFGMCWGIAALAGPLLGGEIMARSGGGVLWAACAIGCGIAALGYVVLEGLFDERHGS